MADILADLSMLQNLARNEAILAVQEAEKTERRRTDVTGRWMGLDSDGLGLVEYRGKIYKAELLSSTCRRKFAPVNLRRTPQGNFVDWQ